jgi:hypothetical protein
MSTTMSASRVSDALPRAWGSWWWSGTVTADDSVDATSCSIYSSITTVFIETSFCRHYPNVGGGRSTLALSSQHAHSEWSETGSVSLGVDAVEKNQRTLSR